MKKSFPNYPNFEIDVDQWGDDGYIDNLIAVLESCIKNVKGNFDERLSPTRPLLVLNSEKHDPPIDHPKFYPLDPQDRIYLSQKNQVWDEYSFQFAHELCHYYMNFPIGIGYGKFSWLEETFADLSSMITLKKMAEEWKNTPPYYEWTYYSDALNAYAERLINDNNSVINIPFLEWFQSNVEELFRVSTNRELNRTIAIKLYDYFYNQPELWKTIQYLKEVENSNDLSFAEYFNEWKEKLPKELHELFLIIETMFGMDTQIPKANP